MEYVEKICPFMSKPPKLAKCLREQCGIWTTFGEGGCTFADRRRFVSQR